MALPSRRLTGGLDHVLDFGPDALVDTLESLKTAGIRAVGAGLNLAEARRPLQLQISDLRLKLIAFTDHPREYAARPLGRDARLV
ncbi:MAG: CapA family protein [Streptosporangiaceae bacterium]|jgi:capsule synthesis protein PGA_cap